jgi:hypothetical protein
MRTTRACPGDAGECICVESSIGSVHHGELDRVRGCGSRVEAHFRIPDVEDAAGRIDLLAGFAEFAADGLAERTNARLKDDFGGRHLRVRGDAKVMSRLMFGMLALTADQILTLLR